MLINNDAKQEKLFRNFRKTDNAKHTLSVQRVPDSILGIFRCGGWGICLKPWRAAASQCQQYVASWTNGLTQYKATSDVPRILAVLCKPL